jgi:hypothetical protein
MAAYACGDFLAEMHKKPAYVLFVRCVPRTTPGQPSEATYQVAGRDASLAEHMFRKMGMRRLTFKCCGWDAPPFSFVYKGKDFQISMGSETAINARKQWNQIQLFTIIVRKYDGGV